MSTLALSLGARIHSARRQQGITSNRLAELCKVGAVHIRKIESGAKLPSIQTFVLICNALHTSPQYLLQDSLEFDDFDTQMQLIQKIGQLPTAQMELAESLIDTMLMQLT